MLFRFSSDNWLGLHLGMSGTLRIEAAGFRAEKHDHLVLQQTKRALVFRDPRQFGRVRFHHGKDDPPWWSSAPEISSRRLQRAIPRRTSCNAMAARRSRRCFCCRADSRASAIGWRMKFSGARRSRQPPAPRRSAEAAAALRRATRFVSREALRIIGHDNSDPPRHG